MKNKPLIIAIVLVIAVAFYFIQINMTGVDVPLTSIQEKLNVAKLDNGLTVTIKEMHAVPLVTIQFLVKVGSRNEPEQYRGMAHIFEHIWFKGTETQPVGSFHKLVESLGGELNAMTAHDWTLYYVTVPFDKFDDIFPYMVDLLLNPLFDKTEIEKEKEVVTEEQRFNFNEPKRFVDDHFARLLIDEHPYKHPIIGYKNTIAAADRATIIEFYNKWYVPNNMNVIIVGDVDKGEVFRKVSNAFSDLQPKPLPRLDMPKQNPITQIRYNSSFRDIGYNYIAMGYLAPKAQDEDRYAMEVLNTIFSRGEGSRLQKIVKKEKNLIVEGSSVAAPLNDMGVFEVVVVVEPEKPGPAKAEVILQLNRLKTQLVTDEELGRAKEYLKIQRVKSQEEIFNVGFNIAQAWIEGDLEFYTEYLSNVDKVTKEDVLRVAQKYFTTYTMYELKPKL